MEFEKLWKRYREELDGDLTKLSDSEVNSLARHYMRDGIWQMDSKEKTWIFITELNSRNASKIAMWGGILAAVAVVVGFVQIYLAFKSY